MSIYVCGDTHAPHDTGKLTNRRWPEQKSLTKDDYLIIAGDFGMIWLPEPDKEETFIMKELAGRKFTTLFIDGNHENFERLNKLPEVDMFGGKVGVYHDSIYHLKRGYVYEIDGRKIFTFGGAMSTDKEHRTSYISWWPEEQHTKAEEERAYVNLEKVNFEVDHVITHAGPRSVISQIKIIDPERHDDPASRFFDKLRCFIKYKTWHFGHYHGDVKFPEDNFYLHYSDEPMLLE